MYIYIYIYIYTYVYLSSLRRGHASLLSTDDPSLAHTENGSVPQAARTLVEHASADGESARAETTRFSKITFHETLSLRTIDMCILAGFTCLDYQTSYLVGSCAVLDRAVFYSLIPCSTLVCCFALYCTVPQQTARSVWEVCVGRQAQTQGTQTDVGLFR